MGKRTLLTGIIVGASIGGLISLLNEDARKYANHKLSQSNEVLANCAKNPTDSIRTIRQSVLSLNNMIESNTNSAVSALNQVENTLNKFIK